MEEKKRFFSSVAVLIGACIGAGVLGIPYVAAQVGFFVTLSYLVLLGSIILIVNLYFGEVVLRTPGNHQIAGYGKKYLGKKGKFLLGFATVFGIYSAIVAYMLGVGESFSFLFFGDAGYTIYFGIFFGFIMSGLLWRGMRALKKFEKIGVFVILILLAVIFFTFVRDVNFENLYTFSLSHIFLPFGVILFALMSFHAIPQLGIILRGHRKLMKRCLIIGTLVPIVFYILFAFVVVGFKGSDTPEIATLALGNVFIFLGILTMFTSYLSLGNALQENFMYDDHLKKKKAWFLAAIVPIAIFVLTRFFEFLSFVKILSIGGVVSGGLIAVSVLLMAKQAKLKGKKRAEYSIPINWWIIGVLSLIFIAGVVVELV